MAYIDLDELPDLLGGRLVRSRPGLVRFRRSDYLGDPAVPLADAVRSLVAERLGSAPQGPIRLLTHLRTFGHCFNPVSFYYCFAADGERLEAIVAEVTNTPWGERHAYVLPRGDSNAGVPQGGFDKALHVSPFMRMDQRYTWRAPAPGRTLSVHIESSQEGRRAFDATLGMWRRPLTRRSLARRHRAPPRRDAADARADLRPRGGAQAQRRARPAASAGGELVIERPARGIAMALFRPYPRRAADGDRGRARDGLRLGRAAGDRARALHPRVAAAPARQPRHRQLLHGRPVGYARPDRGDPRRRAQRRAHRPTSGDG